MSGEMLPVLKLVKYAGLVLFAAGAALTFLGEGLRLRQRAAYVVAAPGYMATWGGGMLMVGMYNHALFSGWIIVTFLLMTAVMNAVMWSAAAEGRRSAALACVSALALVGCVGLMVFRPF
ncbi:hypothetical protein FRC98_11415 [Lujinxingia vulgaris]|uniref:Uncharacterized protein n=1 Tax=Lujinxingia vulgaris TaxID=2600176 RepID=A0A5C6X698_9DELT|nr:hypothetical protein [Lujinxingia vulgaris]TXD37330.1 hypothetical protein FRC98_11415 [Lujinxingia vulgaris]